MATISTKKITMSNEKIKITNGTVTKEVSLSVWQRMVSEKNTQGFKPVNELPEEVKMIENTLSKEVSDLKLQNTELSKEVKDLKVSNAEKDLKIEEVEKTNNDLSLQNTELSKEVEDLKEVAEGLKKELSKPKK